MTIDEFIAQVEEKSPPAPLDRLAQFEAQISQTLPNDYRDFLINCNGGYVGGRYWFHGKSSEEQDFEVGVDHIGGFRAEPHFSLLWNWDCYRGRIPNTLVWINDDPFGNAICLGIAGEHRGKVYFWDHENEPGDDWDGLVESAGNVTLIASSFTAYVAGLRKLEDDG